MIAPTIRVLLTEDVADDAELEIRELRRAGLRVTPRIVDTEESFVDALQDFAPDLILCDFTMPGFDGLAALALAREISPHTPFIFVSGTIGEEYAVRALKSGATDYVLKSNLLRLPAAVERALAEARERRNVLRMAVELELERERMASIVTSIPDALWSVDARTERILYISPAVKRIFDHGPEEFLENQRLWLEVVHADDRQRVKAGWKRLRGGDPFEVNYRIVRPDGSVRWVNNRGMLIRVGDDSLQRVEGVVRDITEQVEQRDRIERLSRIRDFTSRINSTLVRTRDRQELFDAICRIAVEVGSMRGALVGVVDPATNDVLWKARHLTSQSAPELPPISVRDDESGSGLFGRALKSRMPMVCNDVEKDTVIRLDRESLLAHGVFAMAAFPLVVEGATIGGLLLYAGEADFFDHDEIKLLGELTANVAFALELIDKQDRITYLGLYDPLTGLGNRTLFQEQLAEHARGLQPERDRFAVCVFDIDRFKVINDSLGRFAGDALLRQIAERMAGTVGDSGRLARLGADRFVALIPAVQTDTDAARRLEQSLAAGFGAPFNLGSGELRVSAKAGLALYPTDGTSAEGLLANAEAAWKRAKETKEPYLFYTERMTEAVASNMKLENELRLALEREEFVLHYQPKVEIATRRITGVEALIRWQSGRLGLVPPAQFIPLMEETGLILPVGAWALRQAASDHLDWVNAGVGAPRVAVNVSAIQLRRPDFVELVKQAIREGANPPGIDLEITESRLMDDVEATTGKLKAIQSLGLQVAVDDFGTGHSSLAYLAKLPIDTIKIDRSFVIRMLDDPNVMTLVSTIVSMARSLKLNIVAEGVESEEQAITLQRLGCEEMQGYLVSKPLPKSELTLLLG